MKKVDNSNLALKTKDFLVEIECVSSKERAVVSYNKLKSGFNPFKKNGKTKKGYESLSVKKAA